MIGSFLVTARQLHTLQRPLQVIFKSCLFLIMFSFQDLAALKVLGFKSLLKPMAAEKNNMYHLCEVSNLNLIVGPFDKDFP